MKSNLLVLSLLVFLASCSTAYKSGQTPDDVYYSPEPPREHYARSEKQQDRQDRYYDEDSRYYDVDRYRDDRYLRMKIANRRWSGLYDDYYSYNPYNYHYVNSSLYYNSPWNSYSYWNYYYNPYNCCCSQTYNGGYATIRNKPRKFDMSVYNGQQVSTVRNTKAGSYNPIRYGAQTNPSSASSSSRSNTGNYRGSGTNAGNFLRDAFQSGGSNNTSSNGGASRSSSNNSSSSSGSSSGSRSSTPSTAPSRKF